MAAKAVNIPYDTMGDIIVTHNHESKNGLMPLLLTAALAASGGVGGAALLLSKSAEPKVQQTIQAPRISPQDRDTQYELRLID